MGDVSTTYQLGTVNSWTQNQLFNVWIPKAAHPVGVVAKGYGIDNYTLELVCIQSTTGDMTTESRKFVVANQSVSGESVMFIGAVQLHKEHSHRVDVAQTVVFTDPDHPASASHSHNHQAMTDNMVPEISTLLVFEVSDA